MLLTRTKSILKSIPLSICLFILAGTASSQFQNLKFDKFSTPDGLPSDRIHCIKQDRLGFIWIAAQGGLVRYDGYSFKMMLPDTTQSRYMMVNIDEDNASNLWFATLNNGLFKYVRSSGQFIHFLHDPNDSTTISSNRINNTLLDSRQQLWMVHADSLIDKMDVTTHEVTRFRYDPHDSTSISNNRACNNGYIVKWASICEDSLGQVWIYTQNGLNRYNSDNNNFTRYLHDPSVNPVMEGYWSPHLLADRQNHIWVATDRTGLIKYNQNEDTFTFFKHDQQDEQSLWDNRCCHLFLDSRDQIWVTTARSFECLDPKTGRFTHYENDRFQESPKPIYECYPFYEDKEGYLWYQAATSQQFGMIHTGTRKIHHIQRDTNNPHSIDPLYLTAFCHDFSDNLWLGGWWNGLNLMNKYKTQFTNLRHEPNNQKTLYNNDAWPFMQSGRDTNIVWIGGIGLSTLNLQTGEFSLVDVGLDNKLSQLNQRFHAVYEDGQGTVWASNLGGLLYRIENNQVLKAYRHNPDDPTSLPNPLIKSIAADGNGNIWLGIIGVTRLDPETNIFTSYIYDENDSTTIFHGRIQSLHFDRDDNLWICGLMGLNRWLPETESFERYFQNQQIEEVFEDSYGNFWVGTGYNGLYRVNKNTGDILEHYTTDHGLPYKTGCAGFQQDDNGDLWFYLNGCLAKCKLPEIEFIFFYEDHGLPGTTFTKNIKLSDGRMLAGIRGQGLILFDPLKINLNSIPPRTVLTDFHIFRESINAGSESPLKKDITVADRIELYYWQNNISIEMTALHYGIPEQNQYQYYLENYDNDWRMNGAYRLAHYTNLDPGTYTFHAKSANADGFWNEDPVSLVIVIHPPWWATIRAYLLYGLIIAGIITLVWRQQLRRIHMRNELKMKVFEAQKLKEVDGMKSRFFANISHEFRTPITLVLGPLEKWSKQIQDKAAQKDFALIRRNVQRLQRLINQLLDLSRLEAGKMELQKRPEDVKLMINHFVQSFESHAAMKEIMLSLKCETDEISASVDRDKIEKVIYNLLSNALKFTPAGGRVFVSLNIVNDRIEGSDFSEWIEVRLKDTGIGIPEDSLELVFNRFYQIDDSHVREHEGSGIGLSLTKDLVELHGGRIFVHSLSGKGSEFVVLLPFEPAQVKDEIKEIRESRSYVISVEADPVKKDIKKARKKPLALIVEDNRDLRAYLISVLEEKYQVIEAADGLIGLELASQKVPDIIISDVMMPKMDGFQLCEKLKTDEMTSHIPVILLTARATKESKLEGLETGADDYLIKPFDAEELLVRINNLIEQRRRLREKFASKLSFTPEEVSVNSVDESFMQRALGIMDEHLADPDFTAEQFASEMGHSRSGLHQKLKGLTGLSATEFIRSIRLKRAASLIRQNSGSISEIAYSVGFNHLSWFAECFRKQFGLSPSDYQKKSNQTSDNDQ